MRTSVAMLVPVTAAAMILSTESAKADFSGAYAPGGWTFNANGGGGSFTNDGSTLVLTGSNNSPPFTPFNTDYTIVAATGGLFSFNWSYDSVDTGTYDTGGYLLNGVYNSLASNGASGSPPVGGAIAVAVNAGDVIGFRAFTADNQLGAGVLTITNFSVPAPGALAMLAMAGTVAGRRRRRE